ncbi:MAG TPA: glutathione S-transferase family protein [Dongiaceae bacterium]|jgi:glutathione S-transferase|nr:glutathione S-transferase family protein [Dongiaceae bacterium]
MNRVTLFGAAYSVYVRIARLALEELSVPYDLVEIDIFTKDSLPADYGDRHPFGRIPAFEHDGFRLFETDAIVGYIVECFGPGTLLPAAAKERARMRQIMRIMDNYAYPSLVWGVYVEETERGRAGQLRPDELDPARKCLRVLEDLAAPGFLAGAEITLADLWALPMLAYLDLAPSGRALLRDAAKLAAWLQRMQARPSVAATRFPAERKAL